MLFHLLACAVLVLNYCPTVFHLLYRLLCRKSDPRQHRHCLLRKKKCGLFVTVVYPNSQSRFLSLLLVSKGYKSPL